MTFEPGDYVCLNSLGLQKRQSSLLAIGWDGKTALRLSSLEGQMATLVKEDADGELLAEAEFEVFYLEHCRPLHQPLN